MKPYKAFISHRGSHKDKYVNELISHLDNNTIIVDSKDFGNGTRLYEAIKKCMDQCGLFIAVISKNYPDTSEATDYELQLAEDMAKSGRLRLLPIICEKGLSYDTISPELRWMTERPFRLTIRPYIPPRLASEMIKGVMHEMRYDILAGRRFTWQYIGRTAEYEKVMKKNITSTNSLRCIMVSGRKGTGRRSFAQRCAEAVRPSCNIFPVTLDDGAGLPELASALHSALGKNRTELDRLGALDADALLAASVEAIEEITKYEFIPLVKANRSIVDMGRIQPWLVNLLAHPELGRGLRLLIMSTKKPNSGETVLLDNFAHAHLEPLTFDDRVALLKQFCTLYCGDAASEAIPSATIEKIADKLTVNARQLSKMAELIATDGEGEAVKSVDAVVRIADGSMGSILKSYRDDAVAMQVLMLLAEVSPMSIDLLKETFERENAAGLIDPIVDRLTTDGLLEYQGIGYGYVSLDPGMADYLRRSSFKLEKSRLDRLDRIVKKSLKEVGGTKYNHDLAAWYRKLNLDIRENVTDSPALRMPSVVLANVMRLYDAERYDEVIRLGANALRNSLHYPDRTSYTIRYKVAQSHIRLGAKEGIAPLDKAMHDDAAFEVIHKLDYDDSEFLKGFRLRLTNDRAQQAEAVRHLNNALARNPQMHVARRELVEVYFIMGDYPKALEYASKNYERSPDNAYHIFAYFKALLHSPQVPEREQTMESLVKGMARSDYRRSKDFLHEMRHLMFKRE